jgi:hypothetical protein
VQASCVAGISGSACEGAATVTSDLLDMGSPK